MPQLITDIATFKQIISSSQLTVIHFSADWAEQCKQVDDVLDAISKQTDYNNIKFYKCQAEDLSEIALKYKIEAVPTTLLFRSNQEIDRIDGADATKLTAKIKSYNTNVKSLDDRLKELINRSKIMLFMKGNRNEPRCGFSKQIVQILNDLKATYDTFDILTDEEVRQGLKTYSDWPTYPQLYVKGELIGGLDIVKELLAEGELASTLNV